MTSLMKRLAAFWLCVIPVTALGAEIDYVEDFALAADRTVPLKQLIPGTEDYYYYHCLHYQNTEQFDKVDELLATWIKRHKYTARVREIQNRQALLTYSINPPQSLEHIRQQLNLQFNHQRVLVGQKPDLPTALDASLISRRQLTARANGRYQNLKGFEDAAFEWLISADLNPDRRRHLLERLRRPDYANLARLVTDDLAYKNSRGFGSLTIHNQLLLSQLDECIALRPTLLNEAKFVNAYLIKLQPGADVDWRRDRTELRAYLDRLWAFVSTLPPVHNSLKAHVLHHRLVLDRAQGIYDRDRFMTYIQLPRSMPYVNPRFLQQEDSRRFAANLNADFRSQTLLPPVGNDEPLVRSYLQHFFVTDTTFEPYAAYIDDTYLKRQFAETKIVNGLGDGEQWYSLLSPAEYQTLKERVDIDFAPTNRAHFSADDAVSLNLEIKNVSTLIVKVYEINTRNYYRENLREVNTDINLDGLVANWEETHEYGEPSLRRVSRRFDFPQLTRAGVYVIDFIGSGRSSRAVIRKGCLRHLVRTTTAGQVFTILDGQNRPLTDATLWFAGREYTPGENGEIVVPFSNSPRNQPIVLSQGEFSCLGEFAHESENYSLAAGVYVDRESLLQRKRAQVLIRPQLYLNGIPVTLSVLEDVHLVITSVDREGVSTTKNVADFELFEDRESVYEIQTPQRLRSLQFQLKARVQNLSQNKKIDLSVQQSFSLNAIDETDKIEDLHLALIDKQYVLEVLGRTGESKGDRPVQITLKHRDFVDTVSVTLKTDQDGRLLLGPLPDITSITAKGPEDTSHTWNLIPTTHTYSSQLHGRAGETLVLPYPGNRAAPFRDELSLLALRGETFVTDYFEALSIDGRLLQIDDLPPGDYDLWLKQPNRHIRVRVSAGEQVDQYVAGDHRQLEIRGDQPLQIDSVRAADDSLTIQLRNANECARVHIFATRYQPAFSAFDHLSPVRDAEPAWGHPKRLDALYMEGRNIGDEYRYIIDRKYATKYPGNMLQRPSLLLNPWAVRSTESGIQAAEAGESYDAASDAPSSDAKRAEQYGGHQQEQGDFANLDFLGRASAVLLNLTAGADGVISVPREQLGPHQHVHVVAIDPRSTAYQALSLPEQEMPVDDLRLTRGLDPAKHYAQQKQISAFDGGQPFILADITSSRFEVYDSLAAVYGLYATLTGDSRLTEFAFITAWPELSPTDKLEKYSKYACHELNFFLHQKDPEFYEKTVLPYLQNKRDKQFLDHWLLGDDLSAFLRPWEYSQLNVVERILLSRSIAEDRQHTVRHIRDLYALIPPDLERFNFLFNTAIRGSVLETGDKLGLLEAKKKAEAAGADGVTLQNQLSQLKRGSVSAGKPAVAARPAPAAPPVPIADEAYEAPMEELFEKQRQFEKVTDKLQRTLQERKLGGTTRYFRIDANQRKSVRQLYRKLDKTQEWVENNYYHLPIGQQNADLVSVNAFWRDYAEYPSGDEAAFRSEHFADASRNFTEMMFALAVLDLPFAAGEHQTTFEQSEMTLTSGSPLIVFHEEIKPVEPSEEATPILVSQNFFRHGDRYRYVNNQRLDKYITDEFLVHVVYGCQVVITNPTSSPQKLDVLLQVPLGAIPVLNGRYTRSSHIDLQPYSTQTLEYAFYFPEAGQFSHFPVHVARNSRLLAHAAPVTLNVVQNSTRVDRESWDYISQHGTDDDVIHYLRQQNLPRTELDKIAFRVGEQAFFDRVIPLLARSHAYNHTLWSYGIRHNRPAAIRQYLLHADDFVRQCGAYLDSPLLTIDPVERRAYQHMDYRPLVNARAHQLGARRQILNDRFYAQYHRLLKILSYRRQLDDDDLMAVTYYMLLQDRVEDALRHFAQVNSERLDTRLQYDYFTAYLAFYQEQPERARALVERYTDCAVDRWRDAFAAIASQLQEIDGQGPEVVDSEDRSQVQTELAASEASFEFHVESKRVTLDYQNLDTVQVNYYLMDIELLFSRNPFVQQYSGQFSHIRPNLTQEVKLPADGTSHQFALPKQLHSSNVLVEISGGGQVKSEAYYSNSLAVQVIENYGQLRVTANDTKGPLPKVYIKVYARLSDGRVQFYKDGYTDLRGRFDYASLNTNELEMVDRFSLLILSEEHGAAVREAAPPKR